MPRKGRPTRQQRPEAVSERLWLFLIDEDGDAEPDLDLYLLQIHSEQLRAVWQQVEPEVLAYFARRHPGRRPRTWWRFSAPRDPELMAGTFWARQFPIARERIGGRGIPPWELGKPYVPGFRFGIPAMFERLDLDDPPVYESQASYLKRHNLLTAAEARRLTAADFEPEVMEICE